MYKCTICEKEISTIEEYNKETEDISDGWLWEVRHKEEFCNKIN